MKKNKNILILLIIGLILCLIPIFGGKLFGSNVDWVNQHVTFANYFRNNFYKTGKLLPDIAWNLGLGQNIYNFSYYGLLNPIILISYLLPFISMTNYIMISNIILYLLSIYLFYKWVSPKCNSKLSLLLTTIFMLSGPLFYQFHRQIMFVNYMPFLLLSLIEIDKNRKSSLFLLTLYIALIIFSSYYYSVGSILCILIYYIFVHFNDSIYEKLKVFIPIIISALLSGILIIPTMDTIISGRNDIKTSINLLSLFIPDFAIGKVIYGSYTLGLTAIIIPGLVSLLISKNKKNKYLGAILSILIIFPIFRYLLNGGLYIRSKALIPFLPLYVYGIGIFIKDCINKDVDYKLVIKITLIIALLSLITGYFNLGYYLDIILSIIVLMLFISGKKILSGFIIIVEIIAMFVAFNIDEKYVDKEEYNSWNLYQEELNSILEKDKSIYRVSDVLEPINNINYIGVNNYYKTSLYSSTYNYYYYSFYHNTLNTNNITYNHLMLADTTNLIMNRLLGVKYIVSKDKLNFGYSMLSNKDNIYLYRNDYALPLGYATNRVYNKDSFASLDYPYNLEALLTGIVADDISNFNLEYTRVLDTKYNITLGDNISVSNNDDFSIFQVLKDSSINVSFSEVITNKLLFIEISGLEENSCNTELSIEINGVQNKLTCKEWGYPNKNNTFHFLISDDDISSLNINISKGIYKITDLKLYTMDKDVLDKQFDLMKDIQINDNKLTGNINVTNDGYMVLSIPYDKNFIVKIDDNVVDYELVNSGFIGFKINKGYHSIELTYVNNKKTLGIVSSSIGLLGLLILLIFSLKKYKSIDNLKQ